MRKTNRKRPLAEFLGENSNVLRHKRRRFDNIVLLRDGGHVNDDLDTGRYYQENEPNVGSSRRILHAGGKRKKSSEETNSPFPSAPETVAQHDENDIISELTKEFKKARLRPVFFTISSFIQQNVDEVGITLADEPETEVTVSLALPPKQKKAVEESASFTVAAGAGTEGPSDEVHKSSDADDDIEYTPAIKLIKKCENEAGKQSPLSLLATLACSSDNREGI